MSKNQNVPFPKNELFLQRKKTELTERQSKHLISYVIMKSLAAYLGGRNVVLMECKSR